MKYLLILLFALLASNSNAQKNWDTEVRTYQGGVLIQVLVDVDNMEVGTLKPVGKNVIIKYDPFYNKYIIDWDGENGPARIILSQSYIASNGHNVFVDSYSINNDEYFVHNNIHDQNKLTLITVNVIEIDQIDYKLISVFDDVR